MKGKAHSQKINSHMGEHIRALREKLGVSRPDFGKLFGDKTHQAVGHWETGIFEPEKIELFRMGLMALRQSMDAEYFFSAAGLTRDEVADSLRIRREAIDPASARATVPLVIVDSINFLDDLGAIPPGAQSGYLRVPVWLAQNWKYVKVAKLSNEYAEYFPPGTSYIVVDTTPVRAELVRDRYIVIASHPKIGFDLGLLYKSDEEKPFFVGTKTALTNIDMRSPWRIIGRVIWWIGNP